MSRKDTAVRMFNSGFNCSQSVLSTFCEDFNLDKITALKIAAGFGGGCRKGELCGAVSGAIMVLGLKYGHYIEGDADTKIKTHSVTKDFIEKFEEINETISCKGLLGYDISKKNEYKIIKEKGLFQTVCVKVIEDAVEILESVFID